MSTALRLKLAFVLMGILIFAAGVRTDQSHLRAIGIGFLAVAFLLRFVKPRPPRTPPE
jgi:ABC-type transport system involved in cytochrome c biogenesis permease component